MNLKFSPLHEKNLGGKKKTQKPLKDWDPRAVRKGGLFQPSGQIKKAKATFK